MYFSRNNSSGKGDDGLVDLKIYQAILVNGKWKNVEELPINGDDFTSCHPSISSDGTHLYFASNRPEGYGGMDIYVSHNVNGTWQKPVNLGPTVNTSRNEVFPFINKAGQLYFSSNGHKGFGGLDIFYVEKNGDDWDTRKNLGSPFNTKKDDFGFYANPQMTAGYLTSNRVGGKGGDDIYSWKSISEDGLDLKETKEVDIQFINSKKNLNHSNTTVTIEDKLGKNNPAKLKTNGRGMIITMIDPSQTYKVLFEKNGYNPVEREIPGRDLADGIVDISFEKIKCLELFGTVMNGKYNNTIANTTLTITNKCTGETTTIKSKEDGSFDFCLDNGCDFDIVANKTNFSEATSKISTTNPNNWSSDNFKITLNPINKPAKTTLTSHSENTHQVRKHFLGSETSTFKVGQVLTLKNIYYDYNKSNIRPDAATELDYVVAMMKEFPNMQITLSSHTDSRGDYNYNRALSQKRATQARNYIISRGIDAYRITSSGQGESILKNNCRDAVNCSEAEHQINRRTEILINKVD